MVLFPRATRPRDYATCRAPCPNNRILNHQVRKHASSIRTLVSLGVAAMFWGSRTSRETTVLSWALACVLCCLVLVCLQRPWTRQCALPFALESYRSASTLRSRRRSRRPSWQTSPFGTPHSIGSRTHAGAVPCALHRWPHMFRARCSYCCGSQCTPPLPTTGPSALPSANAARCAAPQEVPP